MIRSGKRFRKIAVVVFTLFVLLLAALYFFPQTFLCVDSGPAKADVIIVLGGGGSHERPEHAAELFFEHAAPRILLSGAGDDGLNRNILIRAGVPASAIERENKSRTTRENAMFSAKIMDAEKLHSAIVVTSWYHSRRAFKTFEHFAPGIKIYSRPSYFNFKHSHWSHEFFRHVYLEYIKIPGYLVAYGVWPL